jgi:hypothetical protein
MPWLKYETCTAQWWIRTWQHGLDGVLFGQMDTYSCSQRHAFHSLEARQSSSIRSGVP